MISDSRVLDIGDNAAVSTDSLDRESGEACVHGCHREPATPEALVRQFGLVTIELEVARSRELPGQLDDL